MLIYGTWQEHHISQLYVLQVPLFGLKFVAKSFFGVRSRVYKLFSLALPEIIRETAFSCPYPESRKTTPMMYVWYKIYFRKTRTFISQRP